MSDKARSAHMAACAAVSEELGDRMAARDAVSSELGARMAGSWRGGRPPPGLVAAPARRSGAPAS